MAPGVQIEKKKRKKKAAILRERWARHLKYAIPLKTRLFPPKLHHSHPSVD